MRPVPNDIVSTLIRYLPQILEKRADRQRKYAAHQCRKTDKKDYSTIKEN